MTAATKRYWQGEVGAKDDFGGTITDEFVDGATASGPWATMNPEHWRRFGSGRIGSGSGQRYRKQDDGRWLKVEG